MLRDATRLWLMAAGLLLIVLTAGCTFRISPTETPFAEPIDPAFDVIGPVVPGCRDSLTVTTTEDRDDGACSAADCSLLEAVDLSNHCPGTQTVNLPAGEYSSAIVISDDAIVVGAGAEDTVSTGGLSITPAARAQITGLTVRGRRVTVQAGGALELRNSRIERVEDFGYEVTPPGGGARFLGGAGLINSGEAVLDGVVVWGNRGLDFGGGVVNRGELVIRNSTLENNWPAGLHSQVGSALVEDSTVTGNESGIRLWAGDLILRRTTVSDNTSVGVARTAYTWPGGSLQIDRSSITGNGGSGVSAACVTIENSTLSGNDVGLEALSSELCPRSADLRFVTIAHNAGGGVLSTSAAEVRLHATILSANLGGDCRLAGGTIVSDGHNLDGDGSCSLTAAGDRPSTDARLQPLALNGGTTLNHALGGGSPAIDTGGAACPAVDQRGVSRPAGLACDIGAYESGGAVPPPVGAPTATPAPHPIARITTDAFCRAGPGTVYDVLRLLTQGTVVELTAQNDFLPKWWRGLLEDGTRCWVSEVVVDVEGPAADLPLVQAPPTPTPTLGPAPAMGCLIYDDSTPNNPTDTVCVPRACTPNDQPGGSCTL